MPYLHGTAEQYAIEEQREAASVASRSAYYAEAARSRWQNRGDVAHASLKAVQLQEVAAVRYRMARGLLGINL